MPRLEAESAPKPRPGSTSCNSSAIWGVGDAEGVALAPPAGNATAVRLAERHAVPVPVEVVVAVALVVTLTDAEKKLEALPLSSAEAHALSVGDAELEKVLDKLAEAQEVVVTHELELKDALLLKDAVEECERSVSVGATDPDVHAEAAVVADTDTEAVEDELKEGECVPLAHGLGVPQGEAEPVEEGLGEGLLETLALAQLDRLAVEV